jgi:hypothetical protein
MILSTAITLSNRLIVNSLLGLKPSCLSFHVSNARKSKCVEGARLPCVILPQVYLENVPVDINPAESTVVQLKHARKVPYAVPRRWAPGCICRQGRGVVGHQVPIPHSACGGRPPRRYQSVQSLIIQCSPRACLLSHFQPQPQHTSST